MISLKQKNSDKINNTIFYVIRKECSMAKYKRVLLKLSGEALAGDKRQVLTKQPVLKLQNR